MSADCSLWLVYVTKFHVSFIPGSHPVPRSSGGSKRNRGHDGDEGKRDESQVGWMFESIVNLTSGAGK